ncbi:unnamed protein product [Arabis nemorensis]|uniref:Uncharacterized protein n=1 Tax=Arabis nemorensis TaxID=586526 RepID=A0A565BIY6_9BRAS|nr:unnamed protein product [Arabis nemorensis]
MRKALTAINYFFVRQIRQIISSHTKVPNRKRSFGDRCLLMAKQQRTRLYILRRCVCMLLCWHDHSIHD